MQRVSHGISFAYGHSPLHRLTIPVQLGQGKSQLNQIWTILRVAFVLLVLGPDTVMKPVSVLQNTRNLL